LCVLFEFKINDGTVPCRTSDAELVHSLPYLARSYLSPKEVVGGVLGIGQSLSTLGRILGPLIAGYAYDNFGMQTPYMIGAVAMVVAFAISFTTPPPPPKVSAH